MSTPNERLSVIQNIYQDALSNEPEDLAAATTPSQIAAIQANVANARATYYAAAAAALTNSSGGVEAAYTAAQTALADVKAARAVSAQIATLLGKLNSAASAGTSLLNAAKAV